MSAPNFQQLAIGILDAFQPIVDQFIDILGFPLNGALALIWGGIKELVLKVLFG